MAAGVGKVKAKRAVNAAAAIANALAQLRNSAVDTAHGRVEVDANTLNAIANDHANPPHAEEGDAPHQERYGGARAAWASAGGPRGRGNGSGGGRR